MPKAIWNGAVIAEASDNVIEIVDGNVYFPMHAVHREYLRPSEHVTACHWKGSANYFDVVVDGKVNRNAAWTYRNPMEAARKMTGYVAFWHGVSVER